VELDLLLTGKTVCGLEFGFVVVCFVSTSRHLAPTVVS